MKSFQRMTEFERFATLPSITIDELSKCLVGVSPYARRKDIDGEHLEIITHIRVRIKRTLEEIFKNEKIPRVTNYGEYKPHPHPIDMDEKVKSDIIFSVGFNCRDDVTTPIAIIDRCKVAISSLAMNSKTRSLLQFIGGEAELLGKQLVANNRGLYKKEEEVVSLNKIIGITVSLLAQEKNKSNPSKWLKKDNTVCVEHVKNLIDDFVEKNGISSDGLRASSIRSKISAAIKTIYD